MLSHHLSIFRIPLKKFTAGIDDNASPESASVVMSNTFAWCISNEQVGSLPCLSQNLSVWSLNPTGVIGHRGHIPGRLPRKAV